MKIAIISSGLLPIPALQGGAVENLVDFYLDYNRKYKKHDITVYSVSSSETYNVQNDECTRYVYIDVTSFWGRLRRKIHSYKPKQYYNYFIDYYFSEALKLIRKENYDWIVVENAPGFVLRLKEITQAKIVLHLHNDLLNSSTPKAKVILSNCELVLTVSDYIKNRVRSISNDSCVYTLHNGINIESFDNCVPIKREQLGFDQDDFVIVFSGRIIPEKGIYELLQSFSLLSSYTKIKLLIIGGSFFDGSSQETPFIQKIKTDFSHLLKNVFFTGFVSYPDVGRYLKIGDIAVIPSMWEEPFGLTVLEALSVGLPVITTNSGGIPEIFGDSSIIVNKEKDVANKIADSIVELYNDATKRVQLSKLGIEKAKTLNAHDYSENFFNYLDK